MHVVCIKKDRDGERINNSVDWPSSWKYAEEVV